MNKPIEIMEKAMKDIQNCNDIWRCNYSIGFRNGDVHGASWEDRDLLDNPDKERVKELKNFGTKESLARQVVELEKELSNLKDANPSKSGINSQRKKDIDEAQDVSISGDTKNEQGKTIKIERVPVNSDNHADTSKLKEQLIGDEINKDYAETKNSEQEKEK